ncbi:hypothetical protein CRU87_04235 [Aliarcobacter trophiarum LMG 25534]|uniref:Uncharacterized protein n=1 Tax=Aliarcobacter trophiarum LMG 25534 TaxID=1032241 RepID=A0AAD0QKD6_9BACT|nr:hypothetical protein [Aliarcobacter trophiarum]AXK49644.1 hypothetical protein ATR_1821 [Aliarcobacter trophiarum LMG 25534]RXI27441.1 hypothetical protein CRU89_05250 [Aliarcobacter trophiarum]RXJ92313.1 hypothetical protein CRU87_04235 [Aliarcobacter trophiarum LMG 25534]
MLENFKNSFENSSLKIKIELYLLPILILFLLYILFNDDKVIENRYSQNHDILQIENKKYTESIFELSNKIEELAKTNSLLIQKIQNTKEQIVAQLRGKRDNLLKFLENIEYINNFTRIDFLILKKLENDTYLVDLRVDLSKYFLKNKRDKEIVDVEIEDYIEQEKDEFFEEKVKKEFKINAIIGSYAFINGIWFELNDDVFGYKLETIANDYVILKNDKDIIKLEVFSIEHFKNKN